MISSGNSAHHYDIEVHRFISQSINQSMKLYTWVRWCEVMTYGPCLLTHAAAAADDDDDDDDHPSRVTHNLFHLIPAGGLELQTGCNWT